MLSITTLAAFSTLIIGLSMTYWQWQRAEENAEAKRLAAESALHNQRKAEANAALAWRGFRGIGARSHRVLVHLGRLDVQ